MNTHEHDWQLQEEGYVRSWTTELDPATQTITAFYGGSEDWTEDGDGNMQLVCLQCGQSVPVAEGWEIDYQ